RLRRARLLPRRRAADRYRGARGKRGRRDAPRRGEGSLQRARRPADEGGDRKPYAPRGRPAQVPFLRSQDGEEPAGGRGGSRARGGLDHVTKQSETRDQVLDLIEQLGVGESIPSERQLSADLGVSRLTVRAA